MSSVSSRPSRDASQLLAEQFAKGLESTSKLIQSLQEDFHASAIELTELKIEVRSMRANVETLSKILRDDNGERSMVARVLMLERNFEDIKKWTEEEKKEKESSKGIEQAGVWQLRIAVISGSLGFLAAVATALVQLFK